MATATAPAPPSTPAPAPASSAPSRAGWLALVIIGSLLTTVGGSILGGAAWIAGASSVRADNGFLFSQVAELTATADAVTSPPALIETSLDRASFPTTHVKLRVGTDGAAPIFAGVGPSAAVASYLEGVHVAELTGIRGLSPVVQTRDIAGSVRPGPPADQSFWVASDSGPGIRDVDWAIQPGDWTVVIMNADGSADIDTSVSAGIDAPWLAPIAAALTAATLVVILLGIALIVIGVFGWGRGRATSGPARSGVYPARLSGELRGTPSRWLWLVKWILVIPHWIVLGIFWVAFLVTTIVAGIAILFTGNYPRPIFDFNVGVVRWSWRVSFYAYSALGTDEYPPFSLERTNYPADFDVEYPEHLSHGLVLVKSWLLAIPHLLIVGVLTSGTAWGIGSVLGLNNATATGTSLLSLLVLVAGVILLFSGRYYEPIFELIMGINRWIYRVIAYVALMRDEYPPFRLDQGATEPGGSIESGAAERPSISTAASTDDPAKV